MFKPDWLCSMELIVVKVEIDGIKHNVVQKSYNVSFVVNYTNRIMIKYYLVIVKIMVCLIIIS